MNTRTRPLFLDTTVLSNFASSESIDCLTTMVDGGMVVPAVRDELVRGRAHGHRFLEGAIAAIGEDLPLVEPGDVGSSEERTAIRDRLDVETANAWLATWRDERGYYAPVERVEAALSGEE